MGLRQIEQRLERLVEGAFAKAFRSGLQPVEIARRLAREMDLGRSVGVQGVVAPNQFEIVLAPEDFDRFESFGEELVRELVDVAIEHAADEAYLLLGPVEVSLVADPEVAPGLIVINSGVEASVPSKLILTDARGREFQIDLDGGEATIGRLASCELVLSDDPNVSRRHARVQLRSVSVVVTDLGSTNGTMLNGKLITEAELREGDVLGIGRTQLTVHLA
jgi:hypothetical protein